MQFNANKNFQVYLATHNKHKVDEIQKIVPQNIHFLSLNTLKELILWQETGKSFYENALIKAQAVYEQVDENVLSEDSGLVVEALDGKPGIYSKRYCGENCSDDDNICKLLEELSQCSSNDRKAHFVCSLVFIEKCGNISSFLGKCEGNIAVYPKGHNGFAYDPIFIPNGYKTTFAQMTKQVKNQISHRTTALKQWINSL